ncbi:MAG TPA: hypothetical protein VNJ31_02300 [Methyloceanibacter sp.]|nr:hypothetical protein [Methyloceanibacter sp.]
MIYAIVSPPQPIIRPAVKEPPARPLAYEEMISRSPAASDKPAADTAGANPGTAPANSAAANAQPAQAAPAPQAGAPSVPEEAPISPNPPPDMAALPPDDGAGAGDQDALPWQHHAAPYDPAQTEPGTPLPPSSGPYQGEAHEGGYQQGHPLPGEEVDPNAWPAEAQDEPEEWVQVLVSGAGMHGVASDEAPMLFAFPYGRKLRVISRYGNWVEVTDPQSATTGWMKAQYLAPAMAPNRQQEAEAWSQEEPPRRRRGLFGGLFGRAFGGF